MKTALDLLVLLAAALAPATLARAGDDAFDKETGYRIAHYRAAVPENAPGATRVDLDRVDSLIADGAILFDVMPSEGAGPDPKTGKWRLSQPRSSIPGAVWVPDVGRGKLSPAMQDYLAEQASRVTSGDKGRAVIVFCQSDCWMGWNAVQRLAKLGYSQLYWYPEGTDGWVEWGDRKLAKVDPQPMPASP